MALLQLRMQLKKQKVKSKKQKAKRERNFVSTRRSPDTVILPYGVNLRVEKTLTYLIDFIFY